MQSILIIFDGAEMRVSLARYIGTGLVSYRIEFAIFRLGFGLLRKSIFSYHTYIMFLYSMYIYNIIHTCIFRNIFYVVL